MAFAVRYRVASRLALSAILGGAALLGCATVGALPEVDLEAPEWSVRTGQALWKPRAGRPSLAGEVIVARHENGDVLVSFSKPPLPIFTAQTEGRTWRIDFVERGRSYSGRGRAPRRFLWFRLPELLDGAEPPTSWQVETGDGIWSFTHRGSGENLRVVLDP